MRDYTNTVPANDSVEVGRVGNFVHVKETTGDLTFLAEYDGQTFRLVMQRGDVLTMPRKFDSLRVVNDTAGGVTFTLVIGNGDFRREANLTLAKSTDAISQLIVCAAAAGTVVKAANSARKRIHISGDVGNVGVLYVNGPTFVGPRGIQILPGQTVIVETTSALSIWNPAAVIQGITWFEEND